ncbi:MAG TPA: hypothetical protein VFX96_05950 [Pyrinomonadaceae bacterium]|nr:hypothetical protein [Pyrinomonadaceae bacterium]
MATLAVNQLQLAPLGAGDLIDRTVRLYRQHFMALIRASAPPVLVSAVGAVLQAVTIRAISVTDSERYFVAYFLLAAIGIILQFAGNFSNFIVMGGASRNLVAHLLWDEPVTARSIYRSVRTRFWGLVGAAVVIFMWVAISAGAAFVGWYIIVLVTALVGVLAANSMAPVWLTVISGLIVFAAASLAALYLFFLLAGRVAYVPQAMLVEGKGVFAAISRSATLARGNVRRLMAMFLFTTFVTYSALMLLLIPLGWFGYLNGIDPFSLDATEWPVWYAIGYQVVVQLSAILLTPVWMLGLSLLYIDERVRHEGYDVELQAARVFGDIPEVPQGRATPLAPAIAAAPAARPKGADADEEPFRNSVLGLSDRR